MPDFPLTTPAPAGDTSTPEVAPPVAADHDRAAWRQGGAPCLGESTPHSEAVSDVPIPGDNSARPARPSAAHAVAHDTGKTPPLATEAHLAELRLLSARVDAKAMDEVENAIRHAKGGLRLKDYGTMKQYLQKRLGQREPQAAMA